ncbi:hypothetical protein LY76DRAFT_304504 [Colletotrichum caudatum]|nr:hypothetical protein LY76DRAFT_304504 [Colletotrichum caudatum]
MGASKQGSAKSLRRLMDSSQDGNCLTASSRVRALALAGLFLSLFSHPPPRLFPKGKRTLVSGGGGESGRARSRAGVRWFLSVCSWVKAREAQASSGRCTHTPCKK